MADEEEKEERYDLQYYIDAILEGPGIHDPYIRGSMQHREAALAFLKAYVPEKLREICDLERYTQERNSFVGEDLSDRITDILFKLPMKHEDKLVYLYCLVEHQRTDDDLMGLRILEYLTRIFSRHIQETGERRLPLVYTMVVYNGKEVASSVTRFVDLVDGPKAFAKRMFQEFTRLELANTPDGDQAVGQFVHCVPALEAHRSAGHFRHHR